MKIYFDNAATTPMNQDAKEEYFRAINEDFGNASSTHSFGRVSRALVERARERIALSINAQAGEIFFTSGATESDNWALKGVCDALKHKGNHVITSVAEHPAVLNTLKYMEKNGLDVTYLDIDEHGQISMKELKDSIREDTVLISIMSVNNETGATGPIKEIGEISRKKGILMHTDAAQALGKIPLDVMEMNVDLMSLSGHKMGGPKGIGALYVKKKTPIASYLHGGSQERDLRGGTYNVPAISAFGVAAQRAFENLEENQRKLSALRESFLSEVQIRLGKARINSGGQHQSQAIASLSFEGIDQIALHFALDTSGVAASAGSACSAGDYKPSYVIEAMHKDADRKGTLRFSFGVQNTIEETIVCAKRLEEAVKKLTGERKCN